MDDSVRRKITISQMCIQTNTDLTVYSFAKVIMQVTSEEYFYILFENIWLT